MVLTERGRRTDFLWLCRIGDCLVYDRSQDAANILLAVLFGVPVLMMVFKEPLAKKLEKRTGKTEGGKVMFFVQAFFELFETMLSYFSNTLLLCVSALLLSAMQR